MPAALAAYSGATSPGSQTTATVALPSHAAGDVVVVVVCINNSAAAIDDVANWTSFQAVSQGPNLCSKAFWRRASSTNQFGATLAVTLAGGFRRWTGLSFTVTGTGSNDPYYALVQRSITATPGQQTADMPGLTITGADTLLVGAEMYRNGAQAWTIPDADWTSRIEFDGTASNTGGELVERTGGLVSAGSYVGETTVQFAGSNNIHMWLFAFQSAGAATANGQIHDTLGGLNASITGFAYTPAPPDFNQITDTFGETNSDTFVETSRDTLVERTRDGN